MGDTLRDVMREAISASAKLFYVLISITIIYVSAALNKIDYNNAISNLRALDILYALVTLSEDYTDVTREFMAFRVPQFYRRAATEAYADGHIVEAITARGFPDEALPGGSMKNLPMRLTPGARCDVAVISGSAGTKFDFATFQVVGRIYWVNSEDVYLVSFGRCGTGFAQEFNAILFRTDDGKAVFALPKSFENAFPGLRPPAPFQSFVFRQVKEFRDTLPPLVGRYADLDEPFVMLHVEALRHYILAYAANRHGKFYGAEELGAATSALYQEVETRAGFMGVETTVSHIIRLGPFVFLLIAWELWRHVRLIPPSVEHESTWFPFDVQFPLAAVIAKFFALVPVGVGLLVAYFFIVSQGLGLVVFGRVVTVHGLLVLDFPAAPPIGWRGGVDYLAIALVIPFAALLSLLALVSLRLLTIIKANASRDRRHAEHSLGPPEQE